MVKSTDELATEICNALGLENVQELTISFKLHSVATVTAAFLLAKDGVKQFPAILKEFELRPKSETIEGK